MKKPYKPLYKVDETQENYSDILFDSYMEKYIQEKTFNINKDVDFIYNKAFKKHIDAYQKDAILPPTEKYMRLHTSMLLSKESKKANKIYTFNQI